MKETDVGRVVWAAFEVADDGSVRATLTIETEEGFRKAGRAWGSLEAAETELGKSFGEVARKAREGGSRRGRWRP